MTTKGQTTQQMQQDLQNELITANQLLRLISLELQQLKSFTSSGGEFATNIKQNAALVAQLANIQHINIENLPVMTRQQNDITISEGVPVRSVLRNETTMDQS